jgi:cytochrome c-type biogenesis protein CcmH
MADRSHAAARLSLRRVVARLAMLLNLAILALAIAAAPAVPVGAMEPGEVLADPALEARAREISKELRCLVCQNQSIDDSNAELAHDLRLLVRERVAAGDSNREVVDYVVSRYGDFVLLRPPFKASTYALWLGPAAVLGGGAIAIALYYRRRAALGDGTQALDEAEQRRLAALMEDEPR